MEDFRYASFIRRLIAFCIDVIIVTLLNTIMQQIWLWMSMTFSLMIDQNIVDYVIGILSGPVYFIGMFYYCQATIGSMIVKIRLLSESGDKASFKQIAFRETIGKLISGIILGYGYFWIIADKRNQGFHDKMARTIVIRDK